ncbi:MAG TPA: hypothetical protein DD381_02525 [Lentisphaeria bacterium]|nr:hypothetical protein [Lentisphaeria bacterium]
MKYLIDTHILIWSLVDPGKMSTRIVEAIEGAEKVFVSSITFWEIKLYYT